MCTHFARVFCNFPHFAQRVLLFKQEVACTHCYASEQLPRHHFKTATYATQKPEMEEKTLCCQRRLRDAKTCFVFFRRLGRDSFPWRSNAPILYGSVTPPTGPIRPLLTTLEKPVLHFENLLCIMKVVNRCSDCGF